MISSIRALLFVVLLAINAIAAAAAPVAGDTYVYRVINGYNSELVGQVTYRVDKVDASYP
jgi:MFS-type transporter involved in bile tolerance (Atg22 family)